MRLAAFWKRKTKDGRTFYAGACELLPSVSLQLYANDNKSSENAPALYLHATIKTARTLPSEQIPSTQLPSAEPASEYDDDAFEV